MNSLDSAYRRMQVKVLYSFNNNGTVFLSRSKTQFSVKVVQIPLPISANPLQSQEQEVLTLGAFDLKSCTQQILKSSPENFHLDLEDYAVYYKDVTEQPDEPFVANGVLSGLLSSSKPYLIPGRVCQNLSASYLFGESNTSSLTLEIRLKLHTIEKSKDSKPEYAKPQEYIQKPAEKRQKPEKSYSSSNAIKATRTKSLPIFYHPHSQQVFNIMNADKSNAPSKYDSKSVQDRFKLAPFLQAKIIDNPASKRRRASRRPSSNCPTPVDVPQRAIRTRSMITPLQPISSPINEVISEEDSDDTEYNETNEHAEEEEEEFEDPESSPYTPQQPPYKPNMSSSGFVSLPTLEDLENKKTHTIPDTKLPKDHGLICTNPNCATVSSITWRYFETKFHPNYLEIHRAKEFNKDHYQGMFGPLCNACYLFLKNKGFMRPEGVVKKYLQQQKYKRDLKQKDDLPPPPPPRKIINLSSPPASGKYTPRVQDFNDLNDFINSFGGPLTDIDPLPQQGVTPPLMATKSNTRVINLYEDGEDKENWPPASEEDQEFENMIAHSFRKGSPQSEWSSLFGEPTPKDHTPKINESNLPQLKTFKSSPVKLNKNAAVVNMPSSPLLSSNLQNIENEVDNLVASDMFHNSSSPTNASRLDTVMSYNQFAKHLSPQSEVSPPHTKSS